MKLALLALATAAQAKLAPASLRKPAALAVRGGGAVDPEFYRKFWATTGGIYGAQCLLAPKSMTEMHYEAKSSQMTEFWLRGMSVMLLTASYLVLQVPIDTAVRACLVSNIAIGALLPWNGKFSWIAGGPGAKCKPIHVFPELLLVAQTAMGVLALQD
jgi:hypothetical protein